MSTIKQQVTLEYMTTPAILSGSSFEFTYPAGKSAQNYSLREISMTLGDNIVVPSDNYTAVFTSTGIKVTLANGQNCPALTTIRFGLKELIHDTAPGQSVKDIRTVSFDKPASFTPSVDEKGAYLHSTGASACVVTLPNYWNVNDCFAVRRVGAGAVTWALQAGASLVLSASRTGHVGISERHEEVLFRVIENANGATAVWGVQGATA